MGDNPTPAPLSAQKFYQYMDLKIETLKNSLTESVNTTVEAAIAPLCVQQIEFTEGMKSTNERINARECRSGGMQNKGGGTLPSLPLGLWRNSTP